MLVNILKLNKKSFKIYINQWQLGEKELEEGKENVVWQTFPGFQAKLPIENFVKTD